MTNYKLDIRYGRYGTINIMVFRNEVGKTMVVASNSGADSVGTLFVGSRITNAVELWYDSYQAFTMEEFLSEYLSDKKEDGR